ncbi:MAG: PEP-utilizing enzyme [Xanthomonadales bacterium]|nr:PEP-utilizing enzyme [Xanthomonadales bacterium]
MLGFQIALLDDPELLEPAAPLLAQGAGPDAAWEAAIGDLVEIYAADTDEYFRARAEDLRDLRQRVHAALSGAADAADELPEGAVLAAETLTPSRFLEIDWTRVAGAALAGGSATSHMAMLARARGVPLVTGLGAGLLDLPAGRPAVLDAIEGRLLVDPRAGDTRRLRPRLADRSAAAHADSRYRSRPGASADGTAVVGLIRTSTIPPSWRHSTRRSGDGVGLTRTEFLFRDGPADEATQLHAYRRILAWARTARDGAHARRRRRQAGAGRDPGGRRATRSWVSAACACRWPGRQPFRAQLRALLRAAGRRDR